VVTNNGQSVDLLWNDGGNAGRAVIVELVGKASNRDGIGARIELTVGKTRQVRESAARGPATSARTIGAPTSAWGTPSPSTAWWCPWPSGGTDVVERVPTNQLLTIVEGQGLRRQQPFQAR
jgi:hypothetical protein